ncbi:Lyso-phosphatidylcholine acyltransferase [Malassezia pachydermatis]
MHMDEPVMWGCLPRHTFRDERTVRWSLGASEIIFKNDICRWFFRHGQTLEVFRGNGIYQKAIEDALAILAEGRWVHIFPEGRVNVSTSTYLPRFKWGVSRLVLEGPKLPYVVPIWLSGFDQIMPQPRAPPTWMPRLGADITITFGAPIEVDPYAEAYAAWQADPAANLTMPPVDAPRGHLYTNAPLRPGDHPTYAALRSRLAAHLRASLAQLGSKMREYYGYGPGEGTLVHGASTPP